MAAGLRDIFLSPFLFDHISFLFDHISFVPSIDHLSPAPARPAELLRVALKPLEKLRQGLEAALRHHESLRANLHHDISYAAPIVDKRVHTFVGTPTNKTPA